MEQPTFRLHSNQAKIYKSDSRYKVVVAGRRFGKTYFALVSLLINALSHNDAYLWYVAPTFRQAKTIAWRLIKQLTEGIEGMEFNEAELRVKCPNGGIVELKGADKEDSLRGSGLGSKSDIGSLGLVVDEFASIYDKWNVWHEVLRPTLADHKAGVIFIGTSKGKDSFYDLWLKGERKEKDWASWQFKTVDNKALDLQEEADAAKKETPERYYRQEWEASFEDYEGLIYPEFNEKLHTAEPFYLPKSFKRIGAIDPALRGTTAVLKACIDDDGRVIIYDEFYEKDKRVSEVCRKIGEEGLTWYIDPASQANSIQKDGKLYSLFNEYLDNGIFCHPAENDVEAGINRTAEYFKREEIVIFSTCTELITELEKYHWAEQKDTNTGQTKAKPFKKDDHLCDALRYLIMSRPQPTEETDFENINPNSAYGRYLLRNRSTNKPIYSR